jgi:hypothetical protein
MLEGVVDGELDPAAGYEVDLRSHEGREGVHRRADATELADEHADPCGAHHLHGRREVNEVASAVPVRIGQGDPQLDAMQDGRARTGHLGVADACARGHQVEFTRPDDGAHARAVAVLDLAAEQPADRLQPGVRMRRHVHARPGSDVVRTVVVDEAPRSDERALALWQGPAHPDRPRTTQRDLAGMQHTGES